MHRLPLIAPQPPRLSQLGEALARVEDSGVFSNNGPEARAFEAEATARLFGGRGACVAVANATLGLMLAIRDAVGEPRGRCALMPAMTFAATAEAAYWAGLTPLVCDVDPATWAIDAAEEERLLRERGRAIAVVVPYATFGYAIDLDRYRWLSDRFGVAVVIDAAASLGTRDADGLGFGSGAPFPVVYSMHATKPFATAEGGMVHCGDIATIERLRAMANFGFERPRSATLPGLNAKLPEVLAVMARAKLAGFDQVIARRTEVADAYRAAIGDRYRLQPAPVGTQAMGFQPLLLPDALAAQREAIGALLDAQGVGNGRYFSPHLGEQPWLRAVSMVEQTPVADRVSAAMLTLPLTDAMTAADAERAVAALDQACASVSVRRAPAMPRTTIDHVLIVGGGPAGTALLTAASKHGRLAALARAGLTIVERDAAIGGGRLGRYAITSDSTAQTFLTAIKDNPHPEIAALAAHPAARAVERYRDALGVPLVEAGPLLRATGDRLADIVTAKGGRVLTGHEVVSARQQDGGLWRVRLRSIADGAEHDRTTRNLVVATGGHQPLDRLAAQVVAGESLVAQAGDRLLQSDEVLAVGGYETVADLLAAKRAPRIAVIGGSTSALTTVALLLKGRLALGAGAITLLHRRAIRPFYPSAEAARAEGFTDFGPDDICPVSGFVYRLAGFRLEARELVLRMLGVDGRAPDPRLRAHRIEQDDPGSGPGRADAEARRIVAEADLVIAALGYRPRALPLQSADGRALALAAHDGKPMVDRHCRIVDAAGVPLAGAYGIGLAAGFVPWGKLGGEASFSGQANGLWLWQNDVGMMIVDQLLAQAAQVAA